MNKKKVSQVLDEVARDGVPDDVNLLPGIAARIEKGKETTMQPRLKLISLMVLVLFSLMLLTGVVYAVYHWASDPGLRGVQDAGLVQAVDATGQPVTLATSFPTPTPLPAAEIGAAQTLDGVTVTLDWVYLEESRLEFGFSVAGMPDGLGLDVPGVNFGGVIPAQPRGASFKVDGSTAGYVSYQVIHASETGGKIDLDINLPLLRHTGESQTPLGTFHYLVKGVPVYPNQQIAASQQTYSAAVNGVAIQLESVNVSPSGSQAVLCYPDSTPGMAWSLGGISLALDGRPETASTYVTPWDDCVRAGFPAASVTNASQVTLTIGSLTASGQVYNGPWSFTADLPDEKVVPGLAAATPTSQPAAAVTAAPTLVGSQSLAGVTMTLDWVFADAKRVAFGFTLTGLPDIPAITPLNGRIDLKDAQGNALGGGGGGSTVLQRVDGKPGSASGTWSTLLSDPLTQSPAQFSLDVSLGGGEATDMNNQIGWFQAPPEATPSPSGTTPQTFPQQPVGTFHFDFTTQVYPLQTLEPDLAVTANGIEMRLVSLEMTPSYARASLCYSKPTPKDWMLGGMIGSPNVTFGGYEASLNSYQLIFDQDYGGYVGKRPGEIVLPGTPSGRCVRIDFLLGHSNQPGALTLTIPTLEQSAPEVIPDAEIKAAQEKLKAQGIEMSYRSFNSGGGGGSGPVFTKKPEGMTDQEANQRFMEALGYVYPGPWVFTVEVNQ